MTSLHASRPGSFLGLHDLVEVADEANYAADKHDQHQCPQGRTEDEGAGHQGAHQQGQGEVVAVEDVKTGHEASLATKTKSSKSPPVIPRRKPYPSPWLIRRDRESGASPVTAQPQPDRASSLPASQVFRLHATSLTQIAVRPRTAPLKRSRAALSLVPQPHSTSVPTTKESR
jgi:hypothetical protein